MDFAPSPEQDALRESARRIFAVRATDDSWKRTGGEPYDAALWRTLAESGLLGAAVPEQYGGSQLGIEELAILIEEQGRALAPLPLLHTLVLGALPVARFANEATRAAVLPAVVAGEAVLSAALCEPGQTDPAQVATRAEWRDGTWRLTGVKTAVPFAAECARILVPAACDAGTCVFLVDPRAAGCTLAPQRGTAGEPQGQLGLDGVVALERLGEASGEPAGVLPWMVERAWVAAAFGLVGIAEEALRRTAEFQSNRIQFGRPLGSFQAVQQRAANAYIDVAAMRATAQKAAYALASGGPAAAAAATAWWWACRGADRVTHTAQHLHGGAGADTSYPIHRFFLHAKQLAMLLGGAAPALGRLGDELAAGRVVPLTQEALP
jgi:3-oxocholest-4-en-26-oyl-CoA dehydrogenase beta subunit